MVTADAVFGHGKSLWAVVPTKGFSRAKSRLAGALDGAGRAALATSLFDRAVGSVRQCRSVAGVLVVTDDAEVAARAESLRARVVFDPPAEVEASGSTSAAAGPDVEPLARAVDVAFAHLAGVGASAAICVAADLPDLSTSDIDALAEGLAVARVVIAPDRDELGTNALGVWLPAPFATCFSRDGSFVRHVDAAEAVCITPTIVRRPGLAFDIDEPTDLEQTERTLSGAQRQPD